MFFIYLLCNKNSFTIHLINKMNQFLNKFKLQQTFYLKLCLILQIIICFLYSSFIETTNVHLYEQLNSNCGFLNIATSLNDGGVWLEYWQFDLFYTTI